ncbi:nucleotide exchange factor GrpE [Metabacillus litoralis]|uniref:Nucleotide exchange factor GrpE n=1 Tax=Metabacillus litoralis TaxID=152268 RepID=A0A5C6W0U9_9BACI|nr:nucleotide exchange factor GrpE [Metabacillus litoralis]TXC90915.1 nucleotide exchange factor GrpE [Metabacillus litoralis]
MSFINNRKKKVQNEQPDFIDLNENDTQQKIDETILEKQSSTKMKPTIFDQMADEQSASSTEPITWDPEPFTENNPVPNPRNDHEKINEIEDDHNEDIHLNEQDDRETLKQTSEDVTTFNEVKNENTSNTSESIDQNQNLAGMDGVKTEITGLNSLIQDSFGSVDKQLNKLSNDFETKLKYDQHKDKVIDNLHKELQMYKDNSFQERLTPIIMDLILSIDRTGKILKGLPQDEEFKKFIKVIKESIMDLEDILYKQGVEAYEEEGETFDSNRQKVVKTVKTDQPELDKQIAERLGKGYEREERIMRKELVTVYVYEEASNQ